MADTATAQVSELVGAQSFRATVVADKLAAAFELAKLSGREFIDAPFKRVTLVPQPQAGRVLIRTEGEAGSLATAAEAVAEGASVTTDLTRLNGIVDLAPEGAEISMSLQANGLAIKTPHGRFRLPNLDESLHIEPQTSPTEGVVTIESALDRIRDGVRRVKHSMGHDPSRYYLNGTHIQLRDGSITLTATNGHRLSQEVIPGPAQIEPAEVIVPKAGTDALSSMLSGRQANMRMGMGEKFAWFSVGAEESHPPATLFTRLIDGDYANTAGAMPRGQARAVLRATYAEMKRAQAYASVFEAAERKENPAATPALTFHASNGQVEARFGDQRLPLDAEVTPSDHEDTEIAVQYAYFNDVIKALALEESAPVSMEYFDEGKAYRITSEEIPSFFELIMPFKV